MKKLESFLDHSPLANGIYLLEKIYLYGRRTLEKLIIKR